MSQTMPLRTDLTVWKKSRLFDILPVPAAILNRDLEVVYANKQFSQTFGPWEGRKCWEIYHKTQELCKHRSCARTFEKNAPIVSRGAGVTQFGQSINYTKYSIPLMADQGETQYILEICIDNTSADILRHEYQSLFDLVPCCIVIIDKELRVIDANRMVHDIFGEVEGKHCFRFLKGQESVCTDCLAKRTFATRTAQHDRQVWVTPEGELCNYQVTAVPIEDEKGNITAIMEMAVDITELTYLRDQGEIKNLMLGSIVSQSLRGLAVLAEDGSVPVLNQAIISLLGLPAIGISGPEELLALMPDNVIKAIESGAETFSFPELVLFPERDEESIPVNLLGTRMRLGNRDLGLLLSFHDLREIKRLEKEKMEAERMAAVGHTVSGLAHGIKNLVTALEGGMYMLNSGMQSGKAERIAGGIDMLQRNIERIGGFVKSFLSFSRGREIKTRLVDPASVITEVADFYRVKAQQNGIELAVSSQSHVPPAPIDYEAIHECLTNLVGNAVDACIMTEEGRKCKIEIDFVEEDGILKYRVKDTGCGMDADTRKKVFSNFFTTKGENGTGIGLLMTKKLVQEHGGSIDLQSKVGKGTTFTILLPRKELPPPAELPPAADATSSPKKKTRVKK